MGLHQAHPRGRHHVVRRLLAVRGDGRDPAQGLARVLLLGFRQRAAPHEPPLLPRGGVHQVHGHRGVPQQHQARQDVVRRPAGLDDVLHGEPLDEQLQPPHELAQGVQVRLLPAVLQPGDADHQPVHVEVHRVLRRHRHRPVRLVAGVRARVWHQACGVPRPGGEHVRRDPRPPARLRPRPPAHGRGVPRARALRHLHPPRRVRAAEHVHCHHLVGVRREQVRAGGGVEADRDDKQGGERARAGEHVEREERGGQEAQQEALQEAAAERPRAARLQEQLHTRLGARRRGREGGRGG
mmetsp:Transcript_17050/g.58266  ORF Transcript_17050/g.58266 Transcript_17050/m.58266 type:complete len:296 (+) Transcript_17050:1397-2284(+)